MSFHLDGVDGDGIFGYASNWKSTGSLLSFRTVLCFRPQRNKQEASSEIINNSKDFFNSMECAMRTPYAIVPSMYGICESRPELKRIGGAILLETRPTMTESGPISISLSCISDNDKKKRQLSKMVEDERTGKYGCTKLLAL